MRNVCLRNQNHKYNTISSRSTTGSINPVQVSTMIPHLVGNTLHMMVF